MSTVELDELLAGRLPRTDEERRLQVAIEALRAGPPRAPERLRARVRELRPQPRRWSLPAPRRALLVLVPAVAVAALVAAVVHGVNRSSGQRVVHGAAATPATAKRAAELTQTSPTFSAAGGASGSAGLAPTPLQATLDAPTAPAGRLTRYEASITVRVADDARLSRATNAATAVARSLGGYAASVRTRTPAGRPGTAYLELRVPTARVQTALARLSALGTLVAQQVSVQDLQNLLERQSAQIAQLRREVGLLGAALRSPSLTPVQRVELQLKLGAAKRSLAQRTHARKSTIAAGTLARVSLVLTGEKQSVVVPHRRGRLGRLLHEAVSFLGLEAIVALYALIVVAPLLVLAALGWWAAQLRRRRDERRLLSAPS